MFATNTLLILGIIIWLTILSSLLAYQYTIYRRLTKGVSEKDIVRLMDKVLKNVDSTDKKIKKAMKEIDANFQEGRSHIKRVAVVRFNPFNDMGGDHSFSLALLNDEKDGFILTSLHARERTRVYLKPISAGKSKQNLSKEEENSLKKALK